MRLKLRNHMVNLLTISISTQTEVKISLDRKTQLKDSDLKEFEHDSCFYCAKIITSEDYLKKHIVACHGMHQPKPLHFHPKLSFPVGFPPRTFSTISPSLCLSKCKLCGWYATSRTEMMNHKKTLHNFKF